MIIRVYDAATGKLIDGVNVCKCEGKRSVDINTLRPIGVSKSGHIALNLESLALSSVASGYANLYLWRDGYVPSVMRVSLAPGVYECRMRSGRMVTVRVQDTSGLPVPMTSLLFFSGNVDRRLLANDGPDQNQSVIISCGPGDWYLKAFSSDSGIATVLLPETEVHVVPACLGWFCINGRVTVPASVAAPVKDKNLDIVLTMQQLHVAIFCGSPTSRVLGQSSCRFNHEEWAPVNNIYAGYAKDELMQVLRARFPDCICVAECNRAIGDIANQPAEFRMSAIIDGVGTVHLGGHARPYSELQVLPMPDSSDGPCGVLRLPPVVGWLAEWPPSLFLTNMKKGWQLISLDVKPGDSYSLPSGVYALYQRKIGHTGASMLTECVVRAGAICDAEYDVEKWRWPVRVEVLAYGDSSPTYCSLVVRRRAVELAQVQEWQFTPRDSSVNVFFLEVGAYEIAVGTRFLDGKYQDWVTERLMVGESMNSVLLRAKW
jgi:hypothetical protein